jgi:hypothetical protein
MQEHGAGFRTGEFRAEKGARKEHVTEGLFPRKEQVNEKRGFGRGEEYGRCLQRVFGR